jgi:putative tryptophan/tyrosine transport system substrate-binding protein
MRRREFVTGALAVAGATKPANAQQDGRMYRIAIIDPVLPIAEQTEASGYFYRPFFQELRRRGYAEGYNLIVHRFSGAGRAERYPELAREVISHHPDLIYVHGSRAVLDLKSATTTIPMVGQMSDPVRLGIVSSLARPGGNVTGISGDTGVEFYQKRLELLHEATHKVTKLGLLVSQVVRDKATVGVAVRDFARKGWPERRPSKGWPFRRGRIPPHVYGPGKGTRGCAHGR